MEKRKDILSSLKQCRFCLADQFVELQSLYYRNRQSRNTVTLPMKILSSVSMEVFPSDKMPTYICRRCSFFMDVCYEFKQVCRQADESIFKFIQSGTALEPVVWPSLLSRAFKNGAKKPSGLKTTVVDGTKVEVTSHYMSESEEDNENVYNVKIEDGEDEESARIKVVTGGNDTKKKSRTRNKGFYDVHLDDEDDLAESGGGGDDSFVEGCWACDECECAYPLQQLLELHKMQKHRARNFPCDQCDSKFFSSNDLSAHKMCHSNQLPFQCVACGKKFRRLNLLKRHEKTVHADQPQKPCPRCPATFLTDMEKEEHLLSHTKDSDRQYSCEDCDKKFSLQTSLQKHVAAVHGEKKWACHYCPLRFSSAANLTKHVRTHAGERQYPCKYCDKSFVKSHHYTRHLRVKHQDSGGRPEQYRCEQCEDTFATQDELIYHSAIHATQNLTCPLCQEKFRDVDAVTAHIKSHVTEEEFMCDFCELVFTCKEKLDAHTSAAHDDEIQNSMEVEENESSMDMDAEPEAEEDDPPFNLKEEGGELLLEIKKPEEFMLSNARREVEERGDNTNSEESEAEANYTEMATMGTLSMEKPGPMPPLVPAPGFTVGAAAPAFSVAAAAPAFAVAAAAPAFAVATAAPTFTVAAPAPAFTVAAAAPAFTVAAAAPAFTVAAAAPAFTVAAAAPTFTVAAAAPATPTPVLVKPDDNQSPVKIVVSAQNVRKAEIVKRKLIQQLPRETVQAKKDKPVSKAENNNSVGANDKSLRLLEKELQELKRTTSRNEIPKAPAKTAEAPKTSRRPQLHTSTPKPRPTEEKKNVSTKAAEKKLSERRSTRENKEAKEIKDTKTKDDSKDTKTKDDSKDTRTKDDSKAKQDEKEKDLKEPETPKNVISNGDKSTPEEGPVRRSTRPSKVKDYAKMVRDRSQEAFDDDDSDDDDEEYVDEEKNEAQRSRRGSMRPVAKPTPAKTGPPRKRGRPRKAAVKEEPEVAPKMRKEQNVHEHKSEKQDETENVKSKEDIKITAKDPVAKENDENKASDESVNTGAEKTVVGSPKKVDLLVSPTGATLKKVGTLPPGIKALPLPKPRAMGPGELCEMQIGKKVVKVQKIVMTKAEVEAMAKQGLLEMKDGTMVLKQGIKLPAKEPVAFKSSLAGEEADKESPNKNNKSAPTRCDFDNET